MVLCSAGCSDSPKRTPPNLGIVYPTHHETPDWLGTAVVYRDDGITCVRPSGGYSVDPYRDGIWLLDSLHEDQPRRICQGAFTPRWSHDGTRIALSFGRNIVIFRRSGELETQVTVQGENFFPAWSHDDAELAWVGSRGESSGVWVSDSVGGWQHLLAPSGSSPDWHPAARRLLYAIRPSANGPSEIRELDLDRDTTRVLFRTSNELFSARYSPDGSQLALVMRLPRQQLLEVWTVPVAGGTPVRRTWEGGRDPAWSPDGGELLYCREDWRSLSPALGTLWRVDLASGVRRQFTEWSNAGCNN